MFKKTIVAAVVSLGFVGAYAQAEEFKIPPLNIPADAEYTVKDETVRTECGDCHMVFPPSRLTQNGWKKIMANLDNHFGEVATLPSEETTKYIEDYLVAHAMDRKLTYPVKLRIESWAKKGIVDPIRITELPEWTRHHSGKKYQLMSEAVGYKRGANCIKCHLHAEKGYFEEFPGLFGMH